VGSAPGRHSPRHRSSRRVRSARWDHSPLRASAVLLVVVIALAVGAFAVLHQSDLSAARNDSAPSTNSSFDAMAAAPADETKGAADVVPPPAHSGTGKRIVFSQTAQRVWALNARNQVARTYLVSGSKEDNLKPGTYRIHARKETTVAYNDASEQLRYFLGFAYGSGDHSVGAMIAFHQIPTRKGKLVESVADLGKPASDGCVRQAPADALWLWKWAPMGTKVVVVES